MEQAIGQIKTALINTLSMDQVKRDEANQFLIKQCEPDPQFQVALLHIIKSSFPAASPNATILDSQAPGQESKLNFQVAGTGAQDRQPTQEEIQIQYQAIICMKNSLTRLMQKHRSRSKFGPPRTQQQQPTAGGAKPNVVTFGIGGAAAGQRQETLPDELRTQIKAQLLQLIDNPDGIILSKACYEQLTLVVTIFVKYDFPVQWPQMNQWLSKSLETLHANMQSLQLEDAPRVQRFLTFYLEVLKEQRKKQLNSSKSHFQKMSKEHLKGIVRIWLFFNTQQSQMLVQDPAASPENFQLQPLSQTYNETLFQIAAKLDKLLFFIVGCGFSINNLVAEPDNNSFVETVTHLIKKVTLFVNCVEKAVTMPDSEDKEKFGEILIGQVKTFLKNLYALQASEPLLMFNSLDQYLQTLARILSSQEIYPVRVQKLALIAMFKVVNVDCFNQGNRKDASGHSDGIGILVSPVKFKNLEPQILQASELYRRVLDIPIPTSDLVEEQNRQDGARRILELVTKHYLSKVDLSSWQSDPEYFLENEDEQFLLEYDLQDDCSLNLLAQHLIEKLLQKFYPTCYPFVQEILQQYFTGAITPESIQVEDALLNLVGIVGKVQKEYKVKLEKRLDVHYVLTFIKQNKWSDPDNSPIFRRRFLLILTHWVKILPKPIYFELLSATLESLSSLGTPQQLGAASSDGVPPVQMTTLEQVLAFEHCMCVHELLKEIHYWLDKAEQFAKGTTSVPGELSKDIFELRGQNDRFTESQEEQIAHCQQINAQINYGQLFQLIGSKLVPLLGLFKSPQLIWHMINCLSFILEKTVSKPEEIEASLKYLNIMRILEQQSECHVDDAIIDMLKNLLIQCPSSPVILDMCVALLNFKLSKTLNDGSTMQFWLYTMRAVASGNPSLPKLKELFIRFSGCISSAPQDSALGNASGSNSVAYLTIKRDYIFLEFLKVAKEAVLLDMFSTFEEASSLTQFAAFKFDAEIDRENKQFQKDGNASSSGGDSGYDSDEGGGSYESAMYEKKELILRIPHILMWKVESTPTVDATLQQQKGLIVMVCNYLVKSRAHVTLPNSNAFFSQLLTYLNRILIIKSDDFVTGILQTELPQQSVSFDSFLEAWLSKMELIVQWEAHRIKSLALIVILPYLSGDLVQKYLGSIGNLLFSRLEDDLYYKLSEQKSRANYSPSHFSGGSKNDMSRNPHSVNIKIHERISQRFEAMKREDWLLETDLMDLFWQKVRDLMGKLQIDSIDPLLQCLPDDNLKQSFSNLVNGFSPKHEQAKAEQAQEAQALADQQTAMLAQQQQIIGTGAAQTQPGLMQ